MLSRRTIALLILFWGLNLAMLLALLCLWTWGEIPAHSVRMPGGDHHVWFIYSPSLRYLQLWW